MRSNSTTTSSQDEPFSYKQLLTLSLCLIFNIVDGFDITAMAVAAASIGSELELGAEQLGLVFSFALAGMMFGAILLAPLSDVIGRRTVIISALALVGCSVILTGYASDLETMVVLRFISGLGAGALLACQATLASEYAPEKYRSLAVAAVTAGYPMGAMVTGIIAHSVLPIYGWQGLFICGGATALFMAVIAYVFLPESIQFLLKKQPAHALDRANKLLTSFSRPTLSELPKVAEGGSGGSVLNNMTSLLKVDYRHRTLLLWLVFFLCFATLYFLMSWIPKLVLQLGFDTTTSYTAFTVFNLGGVIGIFVLGFLSTRFFLTYLVAGFLCLSGLLMLVFGLVSLEQTALMGLILLIGISQQGGFTGLYAIATKIYPTEIRSTGLGWAIGLGRSGAVFGPAIAGFTFAAGISAEGNILLFSIPMLVGGLVVLKLRVG